MCKQDSIGKVFFIYYLTKKRFLVIFAMCFWFHVVSILIAGKAIDKKTMFV